MKRLRYTAVGTSFVVILHIGCTQTYVSKHEVAKDIAAAGNSSPSKALVLWGAAWRNDQKDVAEREIFAGKAIEAYFQKPGRYSQATVLKSVDGRTATLLSDAEVLAFAEKAGQSYDKIVVIRVEELGPLVIVHPSPVLWEGGTDVAVRVRVLNPRTSGLERDVSTRWTNRGAFVLKGTSSLEHDLVSALEATLQQK